MDDPLLKLVELVTNLTTAGMMFVVLVYVVRNSGAQSKEDAALLQGMMALFSQTLTKINDAVQRVADAVQKIVESIDAQQAMLDAAERRSHDIAVRMQERTDRLELTVFALPDLLQAQADQIEALSQAERARAEEVDARDMALLEIINGMSSAIANLDEAIKVLQADRYNLADKMQAEYERLTESLRDWIATILDERNAAQDTDTDPG